MAAKIRSGDRVAVIAGREKGKRGEVLRVDAKSGRAVVAGLNVAVRHTRPSRERQGGRLAKEAPLALSNLMLVDPEEDSPTRVGFRFEEKGGGLRKVRYAKRSGRTIDE